MKAELVPFEPSHFNISVDLFGDEQGGTIEYRVSGPISELALLDQDRPAQRLDLLWQRTCFELFVLPPLNSCYFEFNLCENGDWNAYRLAGYRGDLRPLELATPTIVCSKEPLSLKVSAQISQEVFEPGSKLGVTCVLKLLTGKIEYWALGHFGREPDFHDPKSFLMEW